MSFTLRFSIVTLVTFSLAASVMSACVPILWRRLRTVGSAADRAFAILTLRLLPTASALVASSLAASAFVRFEPRDSLESAGVVMTLLALWGVALLAWSLGRVITIQLRTRRALRGWLAAAKTISLPNAPLPAFAVDADYPIVAVVGILRPKLIVARSVIERCSAEEMAAVLAHERGHIRRHDNARRALMYSLPDALSWLPIARHIDQTWHEATEEAADDFAVEASEPMRVHLASALVQVARLARLSPPVSDLPASALYRGEPIECRVRRLAGERPPAPPRRRRIWPLVIGVLAGVTAISGLRIVQDMVEIAINLLP